MLLGLDLVWFGSEFSAFHFLGMPDIFQYWGVALLEARAFTTAGVTVALLALLFRDQRLATEERALFAGEIHAARNVQQYLIPEHLPATPASPSRANTIRPARSAATSSRSFPMLLTAACSSSLATWPAKASRPECSPPSSSAPSAPPPRFTSDPARILALLNERLCGRGFVTCLALRIEQDGSATLVNAGHLPPYLNGKELAVEGALPLGAVAGMQFPALHFKLATGDSMMLMTDGVAEAQDAAGPALRL